VASWADEVETSVNTKVDLLNTTRLLLLQHVGFMLVVEEFDDWLPGITVVDIVTETRSIDYGETDFEELLLQLSLCDLNLDGFVNLLVVATFVVGVVLDCGGEESVDECSLS